MLAVFFSVFEVEEFLTAFFDGYGMDDITLFAFLEDWRSEFFINKDAQALFDFWALLLIRFFESLKDNGLEG